MNPPLLLMVIVHRIWKEGTERVVTHQQRTAGYFRNQQLEGLEPSGNTGKELAEQEVVWGAMNQGALLVPPLAPKPQVTEEMLAVLVGGAAMGSQRTRGQASAIPGPCPSSHLGWPGINSYL